MLTRMCYPDDGVCVRRRECARGGEHRQPGGLRLGEQNSGPLGQSKVRRRNLSIFLLFIREYFSNVYKGQYLYAPNYIFTICVCLSQILGGRGREEVEQ